MGRVLIVMGTSSPRTSMCTPASAVTRTGWLRRITTRAAAVTMPTYCQPTPSRSFSNAPRLRISSAPRALTTNARTASHTSFSTARRSGPGRSHSSSAPNHRSTRFIPPGYAVPGPVGLGRPVETPRDRPPSRVGDGGPGTAHDPWPSGRSAGTYALLPDGAESALLGCVYVDPPEKVGADADVSWWVVDDL